MTLMKLISFLSLAALKCLKNTLKKSQMTLLNLYKITTMTEKMIGLVIAKAVMM